MFDIIKKKFILHPLIPKVNILLGLQPFHICQCVEDGSFDNQN